MPNDFDITDFADSPHAWAEAEGKDFLSEEEIQKRLTDAPTPMLWKVLIRPRPAKRMSEGGLYLPGQAQDAENHLQYVGQVIAIGPVAGKSDKFEGTWDIKPGDWIVFGRYSGQRMTHKDIRLLLIDDDQIQAKLPDPYSLKIYT